MATYVDTVAALRTWVAGLLAAQAIPTERIFWDAFGPQAQDTPGPNLSDPGSTLWARPVLSGEQPTGGGYGWTEKTGLLVLELRCGTAVDEQTSGLVSLASALADVVRYAEVSEVSFGPAHVVPARNRNGDAVHQLNVIATYIRNETDS